MLIELCFIKKCLNPIHPKMGDLIRTAFFTFQRYQFWSKVPHLKKRNFNFVKTSITRRVDFQTSSNRYLAFQAVLIILTKINKYDNVILFYIVLQQLAWRRPRENTEHYSRNISGWKQTWPNGENNLQFIYIKFYLGFTPLCYFLESIIYLLWWPDILSSKFAL